LANYLEPIIEALKDEDIHVRMNATDALGKIRDARAVEPLIEALKDKDNIFLNIQWKAADALCEIGGERTIELLIQVLKDGNKDVREGAAYALRKIKDSKKYKKSILHRIFDLLHLDVDKKFQ
jgi:HEAT repeat protein